MAITGFLLLVLAPSEAGYSQEAPPTEEEVPDSVAIIDEVATEELIPDTAAAENDSIAALPEDVGRAAKDEAIGTLRNLWNGFYANLPKLLVAIVALLLAWGLVKLTQGLLRSLIGELEKLRSDYYPHHYFIVVAGDWFGH